MELVPGILIHREQWLKAVNTKNMNESRLARNLAASLWGSETLKERSVTGSACKRFKKDCVTQKGTDTYQS